MDEKFLSTPPARRATATKAIMPSMIHISIHAPREEGDGGQKAKMRRLYHISIHAPREEGDGCHGMPANCSTPISIHAPREEGDAVFGFFPDDEDISIHAPREEGDGFVMTVSIMLLYFYPRPPRGGRPIKPAKPESCSKFLSTPPARRATINHAANLGRPSNFYPRPPRGGRQWQKYQPKPKNQFLSTPPARRATDDISVLSKALSISIHAPREEGDSWPLMGPR